MDAGAALRSRLTQVGALLNRAQAHVLLGRPEPALADIEAAERLAQGDRDVLRAARFLRAQLLVARGEPTAAIGELDEILADIDYPHRRAANRLAPILILKARAELALARTGDAQAIAEANAPRPERSAIVGAALMVIAEAQRTSGDTESARASAQRAAVALSAGLGADHSETRAALLFR